MGIRSLCAAAVVAVGVGSAVDAATYTVEQYDFRLRYEGTTFHNVIYTDYETGGIADFGIIHSSADPFRIPHRFSDLKIGDHVDLHIRAEIPHVPVWDDGGNGGRAPLCLIGSFDCSNFVRGAEPGLHLYSLWYLFGIDMVGDTITQREGGYAGNYYQVEFGELHYWDPEAKFSIVEKIAPVPLPATAALLPVGVGALAMMRKRRRLA